jgi:tripeptide aminopeptidase
MTPDRKARIFQRFSRYVAVETTSDPAAGIVPSTPGQRTLAKNLLEELGDIGIEGQIDEYSCLYARLPATEGLETHPVIGLLAHLDTSPAVSGANVRPKLHTNYQGGDVKVDDHGGIVLSPDTSPELADHVGHDIVTASGDTLLGADNKAGIAIIMTLLEELAAGEPPPCPIAVAFTPDEEIGLGMQHFQPSRFGADYACTIDGDVIGNLSFECFHADSFLISIRGRSIHPGSAKNQLANPVRIAADLISNWPEDRLPETTENREGFVLFGEIQGDAEHATIAGILRDFDLEQFEQSRQLLNSIVSYCRRKYPLAEINVTYNEQYRNMATVIDHVPQLRERLLNASEAAGIPPRLRPIRGGTDGARLSFMGVPCPNVFVGGTNFHARDEWVSLDSMSSAIDLLNHFVSLNLEPALQHRVAG